MSKNIHVALILDRSGSMSRTVPVTIKGVNEMIDTLKSVAKETNQNITMSLVGFESEGYGRQYIKRTGQIVHPNNQPGHELIPGYEDVSLKDVKYVTNQEVYGGGGTEMNKAILFAIDELKNKKEPTLICIFTDGETESNDAQLFPVVAEVIQEQQNKNWTFAFVGANQDAKSIAQKLSIPETNAMEYTSDMFGTRSAFYRLSRGVRKYLKRMNVGNSKNDGFFDDDDTKLSKMAVNHMYCTLNLPESVKSGEEKDELPPYSPVAAYIVDEYPACPSNWMHGSSKASSYFVAVREGQGMWFDFNGNNSKHDIAVVISVQGVNPITGQQTSELRLEKYENKCPVHDVEFQQDRFCPDCKFKWPAQNYLTRSGSPSGQFWLDGFRSEDGKVRQYVFTEEMARGVANAIMGEDRVFAIGIAFFRSKEKVYREREVKTGYLRSANPGIRSFGAVYPAAMNRVPKSGNLLSSNSQESSWGMKCAVPSGPSGSSDSLGIRSFDDDSFARTEPQSNNYAGEISACALSDCSLDAGPVNYEVAAGAQIKQKLHDDPNQLSYWEDEPIGLIYINYTDEATLAKILAAGKRQEAKEGFLEAVPVGN